MRINAIAGENFLGLAEVEIDLGDEPIVLVAGPNDAGKTSTFRDLPSWVLANVARGLGPKDARLLVRRGADSCKGAVLLARDGEELLVKRTPSASTPSALSQIVTFAGARSVEALTAAFEIGDFLGLDAERRKGLLFRLSGVEIGRDLFERAGLLDPKRPKPNDDLAEIAARHGFGRALREATERRRSFERQAEAAAPRSPENPEVEIPDGKVPVANLSPQGAEEWARDAVAEAKKARDAYSLARGKAEDAGRATFLRDNAAGITKRAKEKAHEARVLLDLHEKGEAESRRQAEDPKRKETADRLAAVLSSANSARVEANAKKTEALKALAGVEARLKEARDRHSDALEAAAGERDRACDHECADHPNPTKIREALAFEVEKIEGEVKRATTASNAAERAASKAEDAARRAKTEAEGWDRGTEDLKRDAASCRSKAEASREEVRRLDASVKEAEEAEAGVAKALAEPAPTPEEIARLEAESHAADEEAEKAQAALSAVRRYVEEKARFDRADADRVLFTTRAAEVRAWEEALKPGGLIEEVAAGPLKMLRDGVESLAPKVVRGRVEITDGFEILYDGGPLALAATSVRWRIAAALAVALGQVSGLRFAVLDEASVCVGEARRALLSALFALRESFDQVVVVLSAEERHAYPKIEGARLLWVEGFKVEEYATKGAA